MPHQCVRCGTLYQDGSQHILQGCSCGAKLFFFVRKESLEKAKQITEQMTIPERVQVEKDVLDMIGAHEDTPVVLDFESIRLRKPGKFELDLVKLFDRKNPIVYKLEEGKYVIDLAETFARQQGSRK